MSEKPKRKREMSVAYRKALYKLGFRNSAVRGLLKETTHWDKSVRRDAEAALNKIAEKGAMEKAVWPLMDAMWSKDEKVRLAATINLGEMGEKAEPAVHALMRVARDDVSEDVRGAAVWALGRVGKNAQDAVPILREKLLNESKHIRYGAAFALSRIDGSAIDVVPILAAALKEEGEYSDSLRERASESLIAFGENAEPAIPELIGALNDENEKVRTNASLVLERIGGAAVPAIVGAIEPPERMRGQTGPFISREAAAKIIGRMDAGIVFELTDLAQRERPDYDAIWLIGELRGKAVPAIIVLIGMLDYHDSECRWRAAAALGRISEESDAAIPGLVIAFKSSDQSVRETAFAAIHKDCVMGEIEWGTESHKGCVRAIPKLISLLKEGEDYYSRLPKVREGAAELLGGMDKEAKAAGAVPALAEALKDEEKDVRFAAAYALYKFRAKEPAAIPVLAEALMDARPAQRLVAAAALRDFGEMAAPAAYALVRALGDSEGHVVRNASETLAQIGDKAIPAITNIALKHSDKKVRENGMEILGMIAEKSDAAIPALFAALEDKELEIRLKSVQILGKVSERTDAVIPAIVKAVEDTDEGVCVNAITALKKLGEKAAPAIPALINALVAHKGSGSSVHAEAVMTLDAIGEKAIPALTEALRDRNVSIRFGAMDVIDVMGEKASGVAPALAEVLNTDSDIRICRRAALALCKIQQLAALPALHKAALERPDLKDDMVKMIRDVSSRGERASGVREISIRPPDSELESMQLFRSRALDARRSVVRK